MKSIERRRSGVVKTSTKVVRQLPRRGMLLHVHPKAGHHHVDYQGEENKAHRRVVEAQTLLLVMRFVDVETFHDYQQHPRHHLRKK